MRAGPHGSARLGDDDARLASRPVSRIADRASSRRVAAGHNRWLASSLGAHRPEGARIRRSAEGRAEGTSSEWEGGGSEGGASAAPRCEPFPPLPCRAPFSSVRPKGSCTAVRCCGLRLARTVEPPFASALLQLPTRLLECKTSTVPSREPLPDAFAGHGADGPGPHSAHRVPDRSSPFTKWRSITKALAPSSSLVMLHNRLPTGSESERERERAPRRLCSNDEGRLCGAQCEAASFAQRRTSERARSRWRASPPRWPARLSRPSKHG